VALNVDQEARLDAMCRRLAEVGVPLFEPSAVGRALHGDEYAHLIVELFRAGEPRLRLAIPCLLAAHDGEPAARATAHAAAALSAEEADGLGLLYRLARCLVASRAPYLAFLFGRRPTLPPLPIEPVDVPDPSESHGERGLWFVSETCRERLVPDLAGGAARHFDTWLDLVRAETRRRESA
jgi:hypothetical protein